MKDEKFYEALARGMEAENYVYEWLKLNFAWVQDSRYQNLADKDSGPRLEGKAGSLILPDFVVYDQYKGNFAVDVKSKSAVYPISGKTYFTVDAYKFDHYRRCVQLMRLDYLVVIFMYESELYWYECRDALPPKHTFGNVYGDSAYLFEFDRARIKR